MDCVGFATVSWALPLLQVPMNSSFRQKPEPISPLAGDWLWGAMGSRLRGNDEGRNDERRGSAFRCPSLNLVQLRAYLPKKEE